MTRADLDEDEVDDVTLHTVGLVLRALRSEPAVRERGRQHRIHRAIGAADELRADYTDLAPSAETPGARPGAAPSSAQRRLAV